MASGSIKFNSLPLSIQERLQKRMSGEVEGVAIKRTAGGVSPYGYILIAVLWFAVLLFLANSFLWGAGSTVTLALITLGMSYLLIHHLYRVIKGIKGQAGSCLLVTPHYVIDIQDNSVRYWDLDQLLSITSELRHPAAVHEATRITLSLENDTCQVDLNDHRRADEAVEQINLYRKHFIEASARNDTAYLAYNDDFIEVRNEARQPSAAAGSGALAYAGAFLIALALTAGVMAACLPLNRYLDDKNSWATASSADRAAALRYYIRTHPNGRWVDEANQRLQAMYEAAEQKYRASLTAGYDQDAADAVINVIKYARTADPCVLVTFERKNAIPETIVEDLKKEFEVKKVMPFDDAFSDEKISGREGKLLTSIVGAFGQVMPSDILDISTECSGDPVKFLVRYEIWAGDSIYLDSSQDKLPEPEKTYNPGIGFTWNFGIRIPGTAKNYEFEMKSVPAKQITYESALGEATERGRDADAVLSANRGNIYDSMVASAFEDFRANLVYKMGIGDDTKLNVNQPAEEQSGTGSDEKNTGQGTRPAR